ncbi:AAA ATPase [Thermoproteus uzoniensis 768-20]|uniref:AAA ATPase n=1 Tax=Thermoproteus uzoniensis (strain 768-20) TaxID=999630 RepID=F2L2P3_THEU7|nr:hypothetical protein [Thermoproteus uzoniensis]AEA13091.1 AAA ATPase [Thermoproteus uzoniensis 768-20]
MLGEELPLEDLPLGSRELDLAMSHVLAGRLVYVSGGRGKTPLLRALSLSLYKAGFNPLYLKLEWARYGWGAAEYVERYYERHFKLVGFPAPRDYDVVLIDDGELLAYYPNLYARLLRDVEGKVRAVAARADSLDALERVFGSGVVVDLGEGSGSRPKLPLGLTSLGRRVEIEII